MRVVRGVREVRSLVWCLLCTLQAGAQPCCWPSESVHQEGATLGSTESSKTTMFRIRQWSRVCDFHHLVQCFRISSAPSVWLFV